MEHMEFVGGILCSEIKQGVQFTRRCTEAGSSCLAIACSLGNFLGERCVAEGHVPYAVEQHVMCITIVCLPCRASCRRCTTCEQRRSPAQAVC